MLYFFVDLTLVLLGRLLFLAGYLLKDIFFAFLEVGHL
jgi:hypothetical protein